MLVILMWMVSLFKALVLVIRAAPLLLLRAVVLVTLVGAVALLIFAGAWAGHRLGLSGAALHPVIDAGLGGLVGLVLGLGFVSLWRQRLLPLIDLGPVAVLTDGLDRKPFPFGMRQIADTGVAVTGRFGRKDEARALDRIVHGVTAAIPALGDDLRPVFLLPGVGRIAVGRLIDLVVLGQAHRTRTENAWEAAHDGLVLVTQNARQVYDVAGWITLIGWGLTVAVFLALLGPMSAVAGLWPDSGQLGAVVSAALLAWTLRAVLIEPVSFACLMQSFQRIIAGQNPSPEWRGRLTQVSDRFRQLGERAVSWLPDAEAQA